MRFLTFCLPLACLVLLAGASAGATAGTLDNVRKAGTIRCGVSEGLPGFSDQDAKKVWHGFDVDFCRAMASAVLGNPDKVEFVPLSATERFDALTQGKIDVLSRNSSWTMTRDVKLGVDFAGVSYYDGQGFLAQALDGFTSALQLEGARICVIEGTTTQSNAATWFNARHLTVSFLTYATRQEARAAYAARDCDVFTADRSALAAERSLLPTPSDHIILPEVISKEPLGPVTRDNDRMWSDLVRWTLFGLIDAEEGGLTQSGLAAQAIGGAAMRQHAMEMGRPAADAFGLADDWLAVMVAKVGNYGEIFERNLGEDSPLGIRRGMNALWTEGGILYAPPM
jgi:general L-amino acid transport system substrate-binding protein